MIFLKSHKLLQINSEIYDDLTFDNVAEIAEELMSLFAEGDV